MKKTFFLLAFAASSLAACSSGSDSEKNQDSIEAARAADSLLQHELSADSSAIDTVAADKTSVRDTLAP